MEKEHDNTEARYEPIPVEIERKGKMVLDAAFKVHKELGPGLLESVYEACLVYEIRESGLSVASQYSLPIKYGGVQVDAGLRLDVFIDSCIIVEVKAVEEMNRIYEAQLLTYLRLTGVRLGYLINFNTVLLKNGIYRRVV